MTSNDATTNPSTFGRLLYHEVCGLGPVVLLVPGTPGDAGHFDALASALSARHTVVTYDRRGHVAQAPPSRMVDH